MSYKKGKDIRVPFDCLWYHYTRKFEVYAVVDEKHNELVQIKPSDFEKW